MTSLAQFVDVILPLPLEGTFTYRVPRIFEDDVAVGKMVVVQFGKRKLYTGLVQRIHGTPPQEYQAKYLESVLDAGPVVHPHQIVFWQWMQDYYMCNLGEVMNAALPSGLKLSSESRLTVHPDYSGETDNLDEDELRVIEELQSKDFLTMGQLADILKKSMILPVVRQMIAKHVVVQYEALQQKFSVKKQTVHQLADWLDADGLKEAFAALEKAPKQLDALLIFLQIQRTAGNGSKEVTRRLLVKDGASASALDALVKKNILTKEVREIGRLTGRASWSEHQIRLTEAQQEVFGQMNEQFLEKQALLIHGVTGSGKTELYIRLIEKHLENDEQVLYMLPEIALTAQIVQRLQKHFGEKVGLYHSRMSDNERVEVWQKQLSNSPYQVVLGARSALFLPFTSLGLVILDEEHEHSFKQHDPAPRYHVRDAASYLTRQHGAKLLLGSATPSIEAFYSAMRHKIGFVSLKERFGGVKLPHIELADLAAERKAQSMKGPFTAQLLQRIAQTLANRQQVIIFQNRRGFSSFVQCHHCGWVPECTNCDISLTYHKYSQDVRCHYCGYSHKVPQMCPKCKGTYIRTIGFGTEQIEEDLKVHFPKCVVARMDLDTTRGKYGYQRIISDFEEKRIDILVGTQMVTKGLDFDHVGLVGILNADQLLNHPDFRAFERAYQLMAQVSGRAGRKGKQGLVVVQTSNPQHFIIEKVVQNNYEEMYASELEQRKKYRYPPFIKLILITVKHGDRDKVDAAAAALAKALKPVPDKLLLGPEYPMLERVRNRFQKQILLKMGGSDIIGRKRQIRGIIKKVKDMKEFRSVYFQPDVDPL